MDFISMKLKFLVRVVMAFCLVTATTPLPVKATSLESSVSVAQATTRLTEADVRAVIDQLQTARTNQDIDQTLGLIAPFAVTVVTVKTGNGLSTATTRLEGLHAHQQLLEQSFSQIQNQESLENYVTIDIVDDNFGIAKIHQMETFETVEGQSWIASSQTVLRLGRVDGRVMITSATVDGWISLRPAQN
jgi:hypothetical protein